MIIVIDGTNRHQYTKLLDDMFALRARVFAGRLGWEVTVENGKEIDQYDDLDPAYVIGVNEKNEVVACVRALQTTGPHMLTDVFAKILDGEPPTRSPTIWESTRFCVDTENLDRGTAPNSISYATCELMAASLEYAQGAGITDIVTVIDPIMNRVLKRSDCAPYGYVGKVVPMGKVRAMAALLDCTDERIEKIRAFAGIEGDMFVDQARAFALSDRGRQALDATASVRDAAPKARAEDITHSLLLEYCIDQVTSAQTEEEIASAHQMSSMLIGSGLLKTH
ncbi:MAG: acyl-homoserine-lactone synthase [Pseudomonadota bacterium]